MVARERADGIAAQYRSHGRISGSNIKIHQPPMNLGERRTVIPANAGIDGEIGLDPPVVRHIEVVNRLAEILVRVAVGDGAGIRYANEEVGQVRAASRRAVRQALGGGAGKSERAPRVLLEKIVVLLLAQIAAHGNVVAAAIDDQPIRKSYRYGYD